MPWVETDEQWVDVQPEIDREKVLSGWKDIDTEKKTTSDKPVAETMRGKVAALFASGGADHETVSRNVDLYSKKYLGDENGSAEKVHQEFDAKVLNIRTIENQDDIMDSIIDDLSEDTGIDYGYVKMGGDEKVGLGIKSYPAKEIKDAFGNVVLSLQEESFFEHTVYQEQFAKKELEYLKLSDDEQRRIFEEEFVEQTPGGRFILSFGEQIVPEWIMPDIARKEADSANDVVQDLGGSIAGVIGSFYLAGRAFGTLTGGKGVRVAPGINNMLNRVAMKSPRASRLIESSLNSFALFVGRDQVHMDGNLSERIERVGEDAILSVAFPVANQLALLPKVGTPLGVVTVSAIGASGKDKDPTERAIGATTMSMVYLLGRGMTYNRAKKDVAEFVKSSGIEANVLKPNGMDAKQWVDSINKDGVIRAADNLYNIAQRQRAIADMAQMGMVKSATGKRASTGEKLAVAKLNEASVVGEAQNGEIVPIRGDRAVEQYKQAEKLIKESAVEKQSVQEAPKTGIPITLTAFHGTSKDFGGDFDTERVAPTLGRGAYFSLSKEYASRYLTPIAGQGTPSIESKLYEREISFKNPLVLTDESLQKMMFDIIKSYPVGSDFGGKRIEEILGDKIRSMGHDGIIWTKNNGLIEVVAFNKSQIKDATNAKETVEAPTQDTPDPRTMSKEEWVESQLEKGGEVFYRGTVDGETKRIDEPFSAAKGKTFVARKESSAKLYGESIERIVANQDAKILREEASEFWKLIGRKKPPNGYIGSATRAGETLIDVVNDVIVKAEKAGYDIISFKSDSDIGTVILNESAVTRNAFDSKTRQQLEAEWDVAQKAPTQEAPKQAPLQEGGEGVGPQEAKEDVASIEKSMLQDVEDFGIPTEQAIENIGRMPAQPFEQEMHYNDALQSILPPKGPTNQDLTTAGGNEWLEEKSKAMRRMTENLAGIFRKFGKQYVSDRPLAEQLEKSYHKIAAQPHFAVLDVHRKLQEYPRTSRQDRTALTFALEADDPVGLPDRLMPIYEQLKQMFADVEAMQIEAGVLTQTFEESQAQRIEDLNNKIKEASGNKKEVLIEERNRLEDIKKYMPHSKVARAVMEEKAANSPIGQRRKFGKRLSQFHKQRKGTHSLKEYLEQGIIDENDVDVVNLAMSAYVDAYHKIAVRGLIEWGKGSGYIIPKNQHVSNPEDWFMEDELHPIARVGGMNNMKIQRLFAQGIEELGGKQGEAYNWWDKALAITKVGAFFNPFIIGKHNISQAVLGGSAGIKNSAKAFTVVATKNDLWRRFDEAGLYQKTDIPTRVAVDELIQKMSNRTKKYGTENLSKAVNILSETFRTTPEELKGILEDKNVKRAAEKAIMMPSMVTSGVTWYLDEFQRTNSALNLMDKGYSPEEAAKEAARIHVAYSNIGDQYKKVARKVLFVHAFRLLMPYELFVKPYMTLADQIYKKATGGKTDKKKVKKAAYVLMATIGLPALYDAWMKLNGWEEAEEERESGMRKLVDLATIEVPLWNGQTMDIMPAAFPHWKYSKIVETVDGPKEIVSVIGTPNVILTRMGVRLTQQFPQAPKNERSKQIWNMAKSEINPLYANLFNFFHNEPLAYGEPPPMGLDGKDIVGGVGEYFKNTFKAWAFMIEQFEGDMTADEPNKLLEDNLTEFEKAMRLYNFAYIRSAPESRKTAMKYQLLDAAKDGANEIRRMKIPDERKELYIEEWKRLINESAERIDKEK